MRRTHTLKATVREWIDETGTKRKHRVEAGALFLSKDGATVVKVDMLPTNPKWSGYFAAEPCAPQLPPGRRVSPGMPPPPRKRPVEIELGGEAAEILRDFGPCILTIVPSAPGAAPGSITIRATPPV